MSLKISVAMATYNGEKFVREQIESILNQTLKPYEIVISDDASTDQTLKILLEYQKKYPNLIKVIPNKNNAGFVKNFERALLNVTGDLVALSDQDDVWLPEKLQEEYEVLERDPNIGLVFSDLELVDETLNKIGSSMWKYHDWQMDGYIKGVDLFKQILKTNHVTGCTIMIRKKILNSLIPFDNRIHLHDYWLAIGASLLSDAFAINKQLVLYRQHSNNQIGGIKKTIDYNQYIINLQKQKEVLYKEFMFRECLFEFVSNHTNDYLINKEVYKYVTFSKSRFELYSSQNAWSRIIDVFKLSFKMNYYDKKRAFLKDMVMILPSKFSLKIKLIRFSIIKKLKSIFARESIR